MKGATGEPDRYRAQGRDRDAAARDAAAAIRDYRAVTRDRHSEKEDAYHARSGSTRLPYRQAAARDRESAAEDRRAAAADRAVAAEERDRVAAQLDELMHDHLTGFYQRGPGLIELEREVVRSHRTGEPFTVAFVDVDGLKALNDAHGHQAGDWLIVRVAAAIRSVLRDYDIVTRYGGDEFLCGMQGLTEHLARQRFQRLQAALDADSSESEPGSASFGVAQLQPGQILQHLIDRADHAMYQAKSRVHHRA